jgi:hypothetical protein
MATGWVLQAGEKNGEFWVENLGGVSWLHAPLPRRRHHCTTQTRGVTNWFTGIQRCACGAMRVNNGHWTGRNERRK